MIEIKKSGRKLGPLEQAIQDHDWGTVRDHIKSRCDIDEADEDSCWEWSGARRAEGYGFVGRRQSLRLVHRLMAWGSRGFPGASMKDFPVTAHLCANTLCARPEHLAPATALTNMLESRARNALLHRIRTLEGALRAAAPHSPELSDAWKIEEGISLHPALRTQTAETTRRRVARYSKKSKFLLGLEENAARRFEQVAKVEQLVARGMTVTNACVEVGMTRSAFHDWRPRMRSKLAEGRKGAREL